MPARRRLTLLLAAIAAAGLVGAGCSDQQFAVRVGETTVSQSDFEAELDAFADLQGRDRVTGGLTSSYTQEFVGAVLGQRIELILAGQVFDDRGLELTDDQISGVREQAGDQLDGFPRDLRNSLIEDVARRSGLLDELGQQDYNRALTEAADSADIDVSSHYGSWDPEQYRVVPPDGPAGAEPSQPSGGDTTGGG